MNDFSSESGNLLLVKAIHDYWLRRGYDVRIWTEKFSHRGESRRPLWAIRSDMANGFPRKESKL
jgi:hypothetical protein